MALIFLSFSLLMVGCHAKPPIDTSRVMSVTEVLKNLDELNGKSVEVQGFMPECGAYSCVLFANEQLSKDFWRIANGPDRKVELPDFLSVGFDEAFDRKAGPLAGRYVVVRARVSNKCRPGGVPSCTDRADDLIPLDIAPLGPPSRQTREKNA